MLAAGLLPEDDIQSCQQTEYGQCARQESIRHPEERCVDRQSDAGWTFTARRRRPSSEQTDQNHPYHAENEDAPHAIQEWNLIKAGLVQPGEAEGGEPGKIRPSWKNFKEAGTGEATQSCKERRIGGRAFPEEAHNKLAKIPGLTNPVYLWMN